MGIVGSLAVVAIPTYHASKLYRAQTYLEDEHHGISMRHDQELARRESLRDTYGQRNEKVYTLMIMDTLMFSVVFNMMLQGVMPNGPSSINPNCGYIDTGTLCAYSFLLAVSICLFWTSVWFVMKMQSRMTKYNIDFREQRYSCGETHPTFDQYYDCHCHSMAKTGEQLYYLGVISMMIVGTILFDAQSLLCFQNNVTAAAIFTFISGSTIMSLLILPWFVASKTRLPGSPESRSEAEQQEMFRGQNALGSSVTDRLSSVS